MESLLEKIGDLNDMILQGNALEAFNTYYHEDVVMQENNDAPVKGKAANRKREEEFFASITEFRGAKVLKVAIGEGNITMVEWEMDYTHKDWGVRKYTQIAVQQWANGQIINERFYYGS